MKDSITIYSSPTCPKCKALKLQLQKAHIEYNEEQNDYSPLEQRKMSNLPILQVGDKFLTMAEAIAWIKGQ